MKYDAAKSNDVATIPGFVYCLAMGRMYFVEAIASNGQGRMAPDLEAGMPYVIVSVER